MNFVHGSSTALNFYIDNSMSLDFRSTACDTDVTISMPLGGRTWPISSVDNLGTVAVSSEKKKHEGIYYCVDFVNPSSHQPDFHPAGVFKGVLLIS
jgi:hypothetical protein